jgi:peptide/nickel transport system substrate-binding protein
MAFQHRPEYLKTPELMDVRVRKALAYATDRQALNEALFDGEVPIVDTFLSPQAPFYPEVVRVLTKYPYDPRRTEELMSLAGLTKDRDGFFMSATGGPFRPEFRVTSGRVNERGQAVVVDTWRTVGISAQSYVLPRAQELAETRYTFPGLANVGGALSGIQHFPSAQIASPANRWVGKNFGGWSSAEYDRLWEAYNTTLDRSARDRVVAQMLRLLTEELPGLMLYADTDVWAHTGAVAGIDPGKAGTQHLWNIYEWERRS